MSRSPTKNRHSLSPSALAKRFRLHHSMMRQPEDTDGSMSIYDANSYKENSQNGIDLDAMDAELSVPELHDKTNGNSPIAGTSSSKAKDKKKSRWISQQKHSPPGSIGLVLRTAKKNLTTNSSDSDEEDESDSSEGQSTEDESPSSTEGESQSDLSDDAEFVVKNTPRQSKVSKCQSTNGTNGDKPVNGKSDKRVTRSSNNLSTQSKGRGYYFEPIMSTSSDDMITEAENRPNHIKEEAISNNCASESETRRSTRSKTRINYSFTPTNHKKTDNSVELSDSEMGSPTKQTKLRKVKLFDDSESEQEDAKIMQNKNQNSCHFFLNTLSIPDYSDLTENRHLMDINRLTQVFSMNKDEADYLGEEEIPLDSIIPGKLSEDRLFGLFTNTDKSNAKIKNTSYTSQPTRISSRRSSSRPPASLIKECQASFDPPSAVKIGQACPPQSERLYEERFLAKPRITLKTKTRAKEKASRSKLGKSRRKLIKAFKNPNVIEVEEFVPLLSVRNELKKIYSEKGFPDWQHDLRQEKLALRTLEKIKARFPHWMFYLSEGFNLILYGFGSKRSVFELLDEYLNDQYKIMELDCLHPKLDAAETLMDFVDECLIVQHTFLKGSSFYDKVRHLMAKLRPLEKHPPVFLFVRSIENIGWKKDQLFYLITNLAMLPFVHMIASCDHFNTPLVFDQGLTADLALLWVHCTTYSPYIYETKMIPGAFGTSAFEESTSKVTLEHVYGSVTSKAKRAFNILASLQLQAVKSKQFDMNSWTGIEFTELARICREKFIANNVSQLNSLLVEFIDNKLVARSNDSGGGGGRGRKKKNADNCLKINVDDVKLEEFIISNPIQND